MLLDDQLNRPLTKVDVSVTGQRHPLAGCDIEKRPHPLGRTFFMQPKETPDKTGPPPHPLVEPSMKRKLSHSVCK